MSTPPLSEKSTTRPCCGLCLSNQEQFEGKKCGIAPWRISCSETLLHSIPMIGAITAAVASHRSDKQIRQYDSADYMLQSDAENPSSDDFSSSYEELMLLSIKRTNRLTMAVLNMSLTGAVLLAIAQTRTI
ncbi:MAG: hypothetical protein COT85_03465 [Chlamydiae bacterium CG10_big_fil_rev_8_21_14_0_10_42_34]|nr:MAG: hypothetical protein COT85_03465 [Chlamydiae bacterium CG10_big_fil_rev_8_21_14_0_10_42_34]